MFTKDSLREKYGAVGSHPHLYGRLAEAVRQLPVYRQSTRIFASPSPVLKQIRINALLDGKEVIMPGPGLKEGFYLLAPFSVPFRELPFAVSFKGVASHGTLLEISRFHDCPIDLMLTEALAADFSGGRLGDGSGFFDLSCAILAHLEALAESVAAIVVLESDEQLGEALPMEPWDVPVQGIISPQGFKPTATAFCVSGIHWTAMPPRWVRKMTPLWKIRQEMDGRSDL